MTKNASNIDVAKEKFELICKEIESLGDLIDTEADTRLHIIDRLLIEVLGWRHDNIKAEPWTGAGYADYLIHNGGTNVMVVEAKRSAGKLLDTRLPNPNFYLASGAAVESARDGLEQAEAYCQKQGAVFAVLTSGNQWIGYWCMGRGRPASETKVIVFPSLSAISEDFGRFYDFFSKEAVLYETYKVYLNEAEGLVIRPAYKLIPALRDHEIKLLPPSPITTDIQRVLTNYFGALSGSSDPEMLAYCFVETRESQKADHEIQKILETLVSKVTDIGPKNDELQEKLRDALEYQRGEFVLVIGNKGAGKSTYMDRFFL